uniref:Vomeronasal type-1 receptor n=1 Tax=Erpetoichthys calabaricus TaxID=27687 RepID=A0A8C4XD15_ERPCA
MEPRLVLKAAGFIFLDVVGIPGNLTILLFFCQMSISQGKIQQNDVIITQLASVNMVVVLCRGIPQALTALGYRNLFNDSGCKAIIYLYRVSRAMSICITSLLSCYQCVLIGPTTSKWLFLKQRLPHSVPYVVMFLCALNCCVCYAAANYSFTYFNSTIPEFTLNLEFCIVIFPSYLSFMGNGVLYIIRDFIFVALMATAGGYIINLLYRHRKKMQSTQTSDRNQRKTADASKAVLALVTMYVILFSLDNIIWIYTLSVSRVHPSVSDTRVFFASCYSALSPILIIATNKRFATKLFSYFLKNLVK